MKEVSWTSRLLWNVPGESWAHGSSCLLTPFSLETGHPGPGASSAPRTFLLRPPDTAVLQRLRPRLAPSECVLLSGSHRRSKGAQATLRGRWATRRRALGTLSAPPSPAPALSRLHSSDRHSEHTARQAWACEGPRVAKGVASLGFERSCSPPIFWPGRGRHCSRPGPAPAQSRVACPFCHQPGEAQTKETVPNLSSRKGFLAALFTTAATWQRPKRPLMEGRRVGSGHAAEQAQPRREGA